VEMTTVQTHMKQFPDCCDSRKYNTLAAALEDYSLNRPCQGDERTRNMTSSR
jgi:hypothetical protein